MIRRKNTISVYFVQTDTKEYIVTLEKLKNDTNGNPRFKAVLISLDSRTSDDYYNVVYTFTGHYCSEMQEARYIVNYHCNNFNKRC